MLDSRGTVVPPDVIRTMGRAAECCWMNVVAREVEDWRDVGAGLVVK